MNSLATDHAPDALAVNKFTIASPDMVDGRVAPAQFGAGGNVSPALEWSGAPAGTESFVVSMYDKDAPTGSGFWHWIVINIPPTATSIPAGAGSYEDRLPVGAIHALNDASMNGYAGIAPPQGETHDYVITIKALGVNTLPIASNSTGAMVGFMSNMNVIDSATLIAKGST